MTGNLFSNPTTSRMYRNALQSLYAGTVMPFEREILAAAPLPADIVDPFASEEADPIQVMRFAYNSLVTWIDEAKKANYFSKRFTDLSKLVLKGVMTMGRGLVTLHARGEDQDQAPMSIGDLIGVASYHFRKSYLGVIQTAKSHPEISERLLVNQLSWTNMLLRLFKTREKLAKPVSRGSGRCSAAVLPEDPAAGLIGEERMKDEAFKGKRCEISSSAEPLPALTGSSERPFGDVSALFEPGAFSAQRALSSFDRSSAVRGDRKAAAAQPAGKDVIDDALQAREKSGDKKPETGDAKTGSNGDPAAAPKKEESRKNEEKAANSRQLLTGETEGNKKSETEARKFGTNEDPGPGPNEEERKKNGKSGENDPADFAQLPAAEAPASAPQPSAAEEENAPPDDGMPGYLKILQNVFSRNGANEEGRLTFTFEEVCALASDPDFNRIYPEAGAQMRKISEQIDSG